MEPYGLGPLGLKGGSGVGLGTGGIPVSMGACAITTTSHRAGGPGIHQVSTGGGGGRWPDCELIQQRPQVQHHPPCPAWQGRQGQNQQKFFYTEVNYLKK